MLVLWGLLAAFAVSGAGAFLGFRSRCSVGEAGLAGNALAALGTAALAALVAAS
jgi:hypothetical protein